VASVFNSAYRSNPNTLGLQFVMFEIAQGWRVDFSHTEQSLQLEKKYVNC